MLEEFALASNGMLLVERIDPAPFSGQKTGCGFWLQAVPVSATGDALYFGLAGSDALDNVKRFRSSSPIARCF